MLKNTKKEHKLADRLSTEPIKEGHLVLILEDGKMMIKSIVKILLSMNLCSAVHREASVLISKSKMSITLDRLSKEPLTKASSSSNLNRQTHELDNFSVSLLQASINKDQEEMLQLQQASALL